MNKQHLELLERLKDNAEALSTWEIDFVESLERQMKAGRKLTETQEEKLAEIEEKIL